ncbi:MAG: DUF7511 domain-containing protein [archaeon]
MPSNPSDYPSTTGAASGSGDTCSAEVASAPTDLHLAIVRYDDRADRGTIHPPGLEGIPRMETWLSADMSVFVDLLAYR